MICPCCGYRGKPLSAMQVKVIDILSNATDWMTCQQISDAMRSYSIASRGVDARLQVMNIRKNTNLKIETRHWRHGGGYRIVK